MKKHLLSSVILLIFSGAALACSDGQFGIQYINNKFTDPVTVSVQSSSTGETFVTVKNIDYNHSAQLCFPNKGEKYQYKVMEYGSDGNNYRYDPLSATTLTKNNYFMTIYATDSHFQPTK